LWKAETYCINDRIKRKKFPYNTKFDGFTLTRRIKIVKAMKKISIYTITTIIILFYSCTGYAQSSDAKKFEVGVQFSALGISDPTSLNLSSPGSPQSRNEAGFGGRFGYNLNRYLALEAEVNFFPRNFKQVTTNFTGGRVTQGLFGIKAGIRKGKFGFFGKARPGFASSGNATTAEFPNGNGTDPNNRFGFKVIRSTQLTADIGGVVEFYPSRRTIIRFDAGDTITRYPDIQFTVFPAGNIVKETVYSHKAQFSAGFGFRF